jgi:hypothetical protein
LLYKNEYRTFKPTHVCKWKNDNSRNGGRREIKENGRGGKFKYDIFGIL